MFCFPSVCSILLLFILNGQQHGEQAVDRLVDLQICAHIEGGENQRHANGFLR